MEASIHGMNIGIELLKFSFISSVDAATLLEDVLVLNFAKFVGTLEPSDVG